MVNTEKISLLVFGVMFVFLISMNVFAFGDESFRRQQSQADDGFGELDKEFAPPEQAAPKVIIKERVIVIEKQVPTDQSLQTPVPLEKVPESKPSTRSRRVVSNGYRFDFQSCTLSNRNIECDIMVRTPNDDKNLILYSHYNINLTSSAFDNLGNQYYPSSTLLGNKDSRSRRNESITGRLIQGIATKIKIYFENVSLETSSISLLELQAEDNGKRFKVQFRDISFPS